ncbi:type II toxin-antitoxin system antitoxin DNA ADP-ribosyl glycohydrolase DarG [Baekduia sp.]|jgi:O-acetyl-ADP-ribose deacetylase (regulator of RNase III)/uncharacterized protein YwgA|uniref:type II toxin-antitoxin system antitoxin DNA ADP-ribosyl glycohydrolase DarG n=1 Tax=Baekduia sp. TaxID=2600305 RepID=UPI002E08283F|nr:macro domain-containing protein [Baekduia sp.]
MSASASNVTVRKGDLFDSDAQCLVNTINTVGVMGKGIALQFKKRFPRMFADYKTRCDRGDVRLGEPYLYRELFGAPWIINFPTKDHWRSQSKLSDIEAGLEYLKAHVAEWGVESLAVPPLGCGEGGLEWRVVGPRLYEHLARLPIPVTLYAPFDVAHEELQIEYLESHAGSAESPFAPASRVPAAAMALVETVRRLKTNPYQPPVGRIYFQKLAYFGTEAGIPTGLTFERRSFGPYAHALKPLTSKLLNNGLVDEGRQGQLIAVEVGPTFQKARALYEDALTEWNPAIVRLVDLMARMTSRQAEIAATVHYTAKQLWKANSEQPVSEADVLAAVIEWKANRKPPFESDEIASTIRNLAVLQWLRVVPSPDLPVPNSALD